MTGGFWAPYAGFQDASLRLGLFADRTLGRSCGITYSDGESLSIVRKPIASENNHDLWLNFLRQHISVPKPPPKPVPLGRMQRLENFVDRVFQGIGEAQLADNRAQMAVAEGALNLARDHVWVPWHEFLLRHKLMADGVGVALDVVGVVAGVAFIIAAAPEIAGGAVVIGTIGMITGASATAGSLILLGADGAVFGFEVAGDEAIARKIEEHKVIQWARIVGTVMILPDIFVGGVRALKEIGALKAEAREGAELAKEADAASAAERARKAKIRNPDRHPGPVQRRLAKANRLARQAEDLRTEVDAARARIRLLLYRDVNASFVSTPGTAVLVTGAPPGMVLSPERREKDENLLALLAPKEGMPTDIHFEIRVSGVDAGAADE